MDSADISGIVARELAQFRYVPPLPGTTVGVPWPEEKVLSYIEKLKSCLVAPYIQQFVLSETYEQMKEESKQVAEYWVVAQEGQYLEWYDPKTKEFGLGLNSAGSSTPVSIGVRGDLVGTFCAM